jgi:hypothetical protein
MPSSRRVPSLTTACVERAMLEHEFDSIPSAATSLRSARDHIFEHSNNQREIEELNQKTIALSLSSQEVEKNRSHSPQNSIFSSFQNFYDEFHQEMDEKTINIDMKLRQATKIHNLDLDQQFQIERTSKNYLSKTLRSLDDRNMRMQSMVAFLSLSFSLSFSLSLSLFSLSL